MKVIDIPDHAPRLSVCADADDIVVYQGVVYRVIASPDDVPCMYCACFESPGCGCSPFNCLSIDKYPNGTHLVCVCPEEGGEK